MNFEDFGRKVGRAILELKETKPCEIILVHHDDADGLCSSAEMSWHFKQKHKN